MRNTTYPIVLVASFLIINTYSLKAQTYVYDAFIKGHNVGEMTVIREVNDESEKISVTSLIEAHMIVTIRVDFNSHSTYMNGTLVEAEAISKTNGHLHSKAITILKNGKYQATVDDDLIHINQTELVGGDMFYFEEPKNIKKVYSLASGDLLDVTSEAANEYYFEVDGKKELHKYKAGILSELRLDHKLYTVIFKLQD